MQCDLCHGTGHERAYEPWEDCPDCDGSGYIDGERDENWDDGEDALLYGVAFPSGAAVGRFPSPPAQKETP